MENPPAERLRLATRERHRQIERVPPLARLFAQDYTLAEYRDLLVGFHGFYAAVEPALAHALACEAGRPFRRPLKLPLIDDDLLALGLSRAALAGLLRCPEAPCIDSLDSAIGVAYVLEGSTQGGMFIRKWLAEHFGADAQALRFHGGYGDDAGALWGEFKGALNARYGIHAEGEAGLLAAANRTFDDLARWLVIAVPS